MDIFHGDVIAAFVLGQVEHLTDVFMPDLSGKFQLVPEALDGLFIGGYIRLEKFERHLFFDLGIEDLIDLAHSALAQLLDNLVAAGKGRAGGELFDRAF